VRTTENGLGLPESLTADEALKWAIGVLAARRRDWDWTERKGLSKDRLEYEKHYEAWDNAAIDALAKLKEGGEA
jgi:hypothetical protein